MTVRDRADDLASRALLAAAQRGEASAQSAIFAAYRNQVARQIQRMTGDPSCVDDLVQEVFISAFLALPGFRGDAQLQTWLYTIAVNKVRNWWDAQKRRRLREEKASRQPPEPMHTPEESLEVTEHRQRFYTALGKLPHRLREAFTSRALEGLSLQEASEILGVPVSTVSYRTRRAERLLCQSLGIPWREEG